LRVIYRKKCHFALNWIEIAKNVIFNWKNVKFEVFFHFFVNSAQFIDWLKNLLCFVRLIDWRNWKLIGGQSKTLSYSGKPHFFNFFSSQRGTFFAKHGIGDPNQSIGTLGLSIGPPKRQFLGVFYHFPSLFQLVYRLIAQNIEGFSINQSTYKGLFNWK